MILPKSKKNNFHILYDNNTHTHKNLCLTCTLFKNVSEKFAVFSLVDLQQLQYIQMTVEFHGQIKGPKCLYKPILNEYSAVQHSYFQAKIRLNTQLLFVASPNQC